LKEYQLDCGHSRHQTTHGVTAIFPVTHNPSVGGLTWHHSALDLGSMHDRFETTKEEVNNFKRLSESLRVPRASIVVYVKHEAVNYTYTTSGEWNVPLSATLHSRGDLFPTTGQLQH